MKRLMFVMCTKGQYEGRLCIYTYTLFNPEFRVAKDKLVSSSYNYDPQYY